MFANALAAEPQPFLMHIAVKERAAEKAFAVMVGLAIGFPPFIQPFKCHSADRVAGSVANGIIHDIEPGVPVVLSLVLLGFGRGIPLRIGRNAVFGYHRRFISSSLNLIPDIQEAIPPAVSIGAENVNIRAVLSK